MRAVVISPPSGPAVATVLAVPAALRYSKAAISTQFAPLPVGYLPICLSAPLSGSIAYDAIISDCSPETTTNRPLGSMLKPRGCFSVGVLPTKVSFPLAPSTRKAPMVLEVRSEA